MKKGDKCPHCGVQMERYYIEGEQFEDVCFNSDCSVSRYSMRASRATLLEWKDTMIINIVKVLAHLAAVALVSFIVGVGLGVLISIVRLAYNG